MENLKIAFCTNGIFPHQVGGMQRHSRLLIDEFSSYPDVDITVLHPHKESIFPQPNVDEITVAGIDPSKIYLLERYRYSKRIYNHIKSLNNYIIYSQGPSVWYRADEFKSRLIINPHGLEPFQGISLKEKLIGLPFRIILKRLFRKARFTVSLGGHLTDILLPLVESKDNIVVLPNAVSNPPKITIEAENEINKPLRALFVGRFAANKGIHILIEAIDQLNQEGFEDEIEFYLAGKGPLFEKYSDEFKFKNVHFLGFVSDEKLQELYENSDLFVLPTLFEGMPTVVLEAMNRALPIIVTDVGATAELVSSANGFLIEKDNIHKLKEALLQFIKLPDSDKVKLGQNSLKKVRKEFTWSKIAKAHLKLFNRLRAELQSDE